MYETRTNIIFCFQAKKEWRVVTEYLNEQRDMALSAGSDENLVELDLGKVIFFL